MARSLAGSEMMRVAPNPGLCLRYLQAAVCSNKLMELITILPLPAGDGMRFTLTENNNNDNGNDNNNNQQLMRRLRVSATKKLRLSPTYCMTD